MCAARRGDGSTTANEGMFGTAESGLDALQLDMHGAESVATTHASWSLYLGCVNGSKLIMGDVNVDMEDLGVSGRLEHREWCGRGRPRLVGSDGGW